MNRTDVTSLKLLVSIALKRELIQKLSEHLLSVKLDDY